MLSPLASPTLTPGHPSWSSISLPLAPSRRSNAAVAETLRQSSGIYTKRLVHGEMHLVAPDDALIPYCNHWASVQLYYAVYSAVRAFFAASNQTVSVDHAATLACMGKEIKNRSSLYPLPWRLPCSGDPDTAPIYHNLPKGTIVNPVSSLAA